MLQAMSRIIWGLIGIAIGYTFVVKTEWYLNFAGRVAWAEKNLGFEGGTRLFYKLLGVLIILIAFSYLTGLDDAILGGIVRTIFIR